MIYIHFCILRKSLDAANTNQQFTFLRYVDMIILLSMIIYVYTIIVFNSFSTFIALIICVVFKHDKVQNAMFSFILIKRLCEQSSDIETFRDLIYLQYINAFFNNQIDSLITSFTRLISFINNIELNDYFVKL